MWKQYVNASSIDEVVNVLSQKKASARVVAGATDLILEMERGVRKGIETLVISAGSPAWTLFLWMRTVGSTSVPM